MDLKTLRTFHLIVKHGSFIQAAEELNYAQSTVTMQIQKLEADLGVQLMERGKKIRLTEAGRLFYEQSLDIVQRMEQVQKNISDLSIGETGTVRIGVTEPTASCRLPRLLQRFMAQYPRIRIALEISSTPALTESLMQGNIDFALCSTPDVGSELYFQPLFQERFVVLLPDEHPLSRKEIIEPSDLQDYRLLITSANCPYRKKLETVLQQSGHISLETMEIGSMTALKNYVEYGFGIALVPEIVLNPLPAKTTVRSISGSSIDMLTGLVRKTSSLQSASAKLYQYILQEINLG
ncbi:LysR family transcriptional regulator [Cohnella cholangitidis]|uniref:LysR family transcriptional regulator n=1 Tax=Cohnella cholangitidis TaxID=2598458 RepID=A0A7G5BYF9_9BACL|nr:LysR family transcriptional regulator [Cohnella cholangitidis]QMV41993.1 LysR family transcriptional regulator [Cohnella cholangitidis]